MTGVSRDAPIGIQCLQKLSGWLCPRMQINRLRWYQGAVLLLTYFTYMTYHLTRKPISVVKSVLHQNCSGLVPPPGTDTSDDQWCNWPPFNTSDANTLLGALDSAFLFSYAGAMFISGMVAERVDLRYFLSLGMLVSAIFCYLFGLGKTLSIHSISFYLLVQAGAGIAQTTGWPGTVATVGKWFGNSKKGLIFGIWNSHTSLGTIMAAEFVEADWALSFIYPALGMGFVGTLVWLFLPSEPRHVGLVISPRPESRQSRRSEDEEEPSQVIVGDQPQSDEADESTALLRRPSRENGESAVSLSRALAIPGVLEFSLSLFFAKLVSYTFLYWLPLYINTSKICTYSFPTWLREKAKFEILGSPLVASLTPKQSGELSTAFDVGGVLGAVLAGLLADCAGCPALVCAAFYTFCAPVLLAYQRWGAVSYGLNVFSTHSSLAGDAKALATVTAIIDGTGSIGAAIGPMLAGVVSSSGSWSHVFYMLISCDLLALCLLLRIVKSEVVKLRQERRMASPRIIRIE
ncbi:Sugar phosphate exchanger 2 [Papilio xuthus]|uniref:Sugar phosphate exchanger 3 n=1 Tax=Papilio xuthus TaxID=66420 RepID=A0A194PTM2_PAPXU|nr:Sugar phosphate exchanger 2 [Papilio xuthus]